MMKKNNLNTSYWENRYCNNDIGWDIGYPSYPIKTYIDQLKDKTKKILIPGSGNSYEAEYLCNQGFKNVYVADIAKSPLENLKNRVPNFPKNQLLHQDFFKLDMNFDLVIEQTFFCALDPNKRKKYVEKMNQVITKNGKLVGLFFNFPLTQTKPPFGGSLKDYQLLFEKNFKIKVLEPSINSIKERQGKELFFIFEKM